MPMSVLDAAANVGGDYVGGVAALAPRIGKNPTSLAHELNRTGSAKLGLHDSVKMTLATRDFRILDAFNRVCGRMSITLPDSSDEGVSDCMKRLAVANEKFGKVAHTTCMALDDGVITRNEQRDYRDAMGELIRAMHCLDAALELNRKEHEPRLGSAASGGDA